MLYCCALGMMQKVVVGGGWVSDDGLLVRGSARGLGHRVPRVAT